MWEGWRVAIEPIYVFTDYNGVSGDFFEDYAADSFDEAATKLFDERRTDPVGYRCYALDVVPAFEWYAKWPLLRRSNRGGFFRRRARQGAAPWQFLQTTRCSRSGGGPSRWGSVGRTCFG